MFEQNSLDLEKDWTVSEREKLGNYLLQKLSILSGNTMETKKLDCTHQLSFQNFNIHCEATESNNFVLTPDYCQSNVYDNYTSDTKEIVKCDRKTLSKTRMKQLSKTNMFPIEITILSGRKKWHIQPKKVASSARDICLPENIFDIIQSTDRDLNYQSMSNDFEEESTKFLYPVSSNPRHLSKIYSHGDKYIKCLKDKLKLEKGVGTQSPKKKVKVIKRCRNVGTTMNSPQLEKLYTSVGTECDDKIMKNSKPLMKSITVGTDFEEQPKKKMSNKNTSTETEEKCYRMETLYHKPPKHRESKNHRDTKKNKKLNDGQRDNKYVQTKEESNLCCIKKKSKYSFSTLMKKIGIRKGSKTVLSTTELKTAKMHSNVVLCPKEPTARLLVSTSNDKNKQTELPTTNNVEKDTDHHKIAKELSETLKLLIKMETKENHRHINNIINELCKQRSDMKKIMDLYQKVFDSFESPAKQEQTLNPKRSVSKKLIQCDINVSKNSTGQQVENNYCNLCKLKLCGSCDEKLNKELLNVIQKIKKGKNSSDKELDKINEVSSKISDTGIESIISENGTYKTSPDFTTYESIQKSGNEWTPPASVKNIRKFKEGKKPSWTAKIRGNLNIFRKWF